MKSAVAIAITFFLLITVGILGRDMLTFRRAVSEWVAKFRGRLREIDDQIWHR